MHSLPIDDLSIVRYDNGVIRLITNPEEPVQGEIVDISDAGLTQQFISVNEVLAEMYNGFASRSNGITNEAFQAVNELLLSTTQSIDIGRIRAYLRRVLDSNYCPYFAPIERTNGHHIVLVNDKPHEFDIAETLIELGDEFENVIQRSDVREDTAVLHTGFTDQRSMQPGFCYRLTNARLAVRQSFLDRGLVVTDMHPHKATGSDRLNPNPVREREPLYISDYIPMISIRRMFVASNGAPDDRLFMDTPKAHAAFERFRISRRR